jgi:hypothetical protein
MNSAQRINRVGSDLTRPHSLRHQRSIKQTVVLYSPLLVGVALLMADLALRDAGIVARFSVGAVRPLRFRRTRDLPARFPETPPAWATDLGEKRSPRTRNTAASNFGDSCSGGNRHPTYGIGVFVLQAFPSNTSLGMPRPPVRGQNLAE